MVVHTKERCTSCGVWKTKQSECYHCSPAPNRKQAAAARLRAEQVAADVPYSPSVRRTKERCTSCGVWKDIEGACYLCSKLPNRAQAAAAQLKAASSPRPVRSLPQRTKERCTSCGVWKDIQGACYLCSVAPNRMQVQASMARLPSALVQFSSTVRHHPSNRPSSEDMSIE